MLLNAKGEINLMDCGKINSVDQNDYALVKNNIMWMFLTLSWLSMLSKNDPPILFKADTYMLM